MARALIPLANGFEDIEAMSIVDILRRGGVETVTASVHPSPAVRSAHGIEVRADRLLLDAEEENFDAIVLPGGGEGTENLKNCDRLIRKIQRQRETGGLLCAICAAPTVLEEAGVLEMAQHITSYPTCRLEFGCQWIDQPVVVHDGIITSQSPGTAMLFALVTLQALTDESTARKVARGLVFEF